MAETDTADDPLTTPRALAIEGGHNLRDMGGYRTRTGQRVKWGILYRSGAITSLTESSRAALHRLGIAAICDLRTPGERARVPMDWHEGSAIPYHASDLELSIGNLQNFVSPTGGRAGAMRAAMHGIYRNLPFEQAASYRRIFHLLAQGQVPLLFNCAAGKDRTGLAAALILYTLDVPRETIEHDYILTNQAIAELEATMLRDVHFAGVAALGREEYLPLLDANPEYLSIAFRAIEEKHGSIDNYLHDALGVGAAELKKLRELLLTA
ncbi:tyrosine-protein phosphatase [Acidocella sp. KAb 2-4]|uniref:tyrosine-protein phosphatase n=1 Tax=Acidocella sp. KAb 2-4 TaxID=2885158 RepID=UPI001D0710B2|nr:tyrosine-protein phosphatase [Acidocella sp. KAb 2-4]MCB5943349.1 tyrosine-protein phosphatase [Acidocella sp. KAb 2-4]